MKYFYYDANVNSDLSVTPSSLTMNTLSDHANLNSDLSVTPSSCTSHHIPSKKSKSQKSTRISSSHKWRRINKSTTAKRQQVNKLLKPPSLLTMNTSRDHANVNRDLSVTPCSCTSHHTPSKKLKNQISSGSINFSTFAFSNKNNITYGSSSSATHVISTETSQRSQQEQRKSSYSTERRGDFKSRCQSSRNGCGYSRSERNSNQSRFSRRNTRPLHQSRSSRRNTGCSNRRQRCQCKKFKPEQLRTWSSFFCTAHPEGQIDLTQLSRPCKPIRGRVLFAGGKKVCAEWVIFGKCSACESGNGFKAHSDETRGVLVAFSPLRRVYLEHAIFQSGEKLRKAIAANRQVRLPIPPKPEEFVKHKEAIISLFQRRLTWILTIA